MAQPWGSHQNRTRLCSLLNTDGIGDINLHHDAARQDPGLEVPRLRESGSSPQRLPSRHITIYGITQLR